MLVLLPLRGWVGEAMAGQVAGHPAGQRMAAAATMAHAEHAMDTGHATAPAHAPHAGCAEQAHHDGCGAAQDGDCGTCASCQACSSVALSPTVLLPVGSHFTQPRPETVTVAYASVEPPLAFKPPRG